MFENHRKASSSLQCYFQSEPQVPVSLRDMLINLCPSLPIEETGQKQPIGLGDIMSSVTSGCLQGALNPET